MTSDTRSQTVLFPDLFDNPLLARFDQPHTSSDGGAVLLKAAEKVYGLVAGFVRCLVDRREPGKVRHTLADLLGQRIFGIACGHPDGNLTILLNANCLQQAYADTQESGRDFHLHPWRKMPIPRYDETKTLHKEIAALCTDAEKIAERTVNEQLKATPGKRQVSLSKAVRKALAGAGIDAAIDGCARQLLPDHVG